MSQLWFRKNPKQILALRVLLVSVGVCFFAVFLALSLGEHADSFLGYIAVILFLSGFVTGFVAVFFVLALDATGFLRCIQRKPTDSSHATSPARTDKHFRSNIDSILWKTLRTLFLNPWVELASAVIAAVIVIALTSPFGKQPDLLIVLGGIGGFAGFCVLRVILALKKPHI